MSLLAYFDDEVIA